MTIWHAGHERGFIKDGAGQAAAFTSTSTFYDSNYSRSAVAGYSASGTYSPYIDLLSDRGAQDSNGIWFVASYGWTNGSTDGSVALKATDASGNKAFEVIHNTGPTLKLRVYEYQSSTYHDSPTTSFITGQLVRIGVHIYTGAGGLIGDLYINGTLVASTTTASKSNTGIRYIYLGGTGSTSTQSLYWSEIIIGNENLLAHRYYTRYPTAAGTYAEGTGTYTNADEITPDGAVVRLSGSGQRFTAKISALPASNLDIKEVWMGQWVCNDGSATLLPLVRSNSTDTAGSSLGATPSYSSYKTQYTTDPGTGEAWSGDLSTVEFGIKQQ